MKQEIPLTDYTMMGFVKAAVDGLKYDMKMNNQSAYATRLHNLKLMIARYEKAERKAAVQK